MKFVTSVLLTLSFAVIGLLSIVSASEDDCYLMVSNPDQIEPEIVRNLSRSLISKYIKQVEQIPRAGVGSDECFYQVSIKRSKKTLLVTIAGETVNGIGESKKEGYEGIQEAILKAVHNGRADKRSAICRDFRDRLEKRCENVQPGPVGPGVTMDLSRSTRHPGKLLKGNCSFLGEQRDYRHCDLSRKVFRNLNLRGSDFSGVDLKRAQLINCTLADTIFKGANLERALFKNTSISRSDFSRSDMERSRFINTSINQSDFTGSKLDRAIFTSITLNQVSLRDAKLEKADFRNATLNSVDLTGADVDDANFGGATLNGAILVDVDLDDVNLSRTNLNNIVH